MLLQKKKIRKILVISLSNIGDVMMSFPVLDVLFRDFPRARISVVVGPRARPLFKDNDRIEEVHVYHKHQRPWQIIPWLVKLRKRNYDVIVDLKNTAIPFLVSQRYVTSPFLIRLKDQHMCQQHLRRLRSLYPYSEDPAPRVAFQPSPKDRLAARNLLYEVLGNRKPCVVMAPGAANAGKRWAVARFAALADRIMAESGVPVVVVGHDQDGKIADAMQGRMQQKLVNLCGRTSLTQLAEILLSSCLMICNDSSPMQMASYLDIPILAVFGPTDPVRFGPWSSQNRVVSRKLKCQACQKHKKKKDHTCLQAVTVEDVFSRLDVSPGSVLLR